MGNTYSQLYYHFVWSTLGRQKLIFKNSQDRLYGYIGSIIKSENASLIKIGGIDDHVHLLVKAPVTIYLPDLVKKVKANSSKWMNKTFPGYIKFGWQTGYGAFSVSPSSLPKVINYIQNQDKHHNGLSFKEEFLSLLDKHGIEYDLKYVFD